MEIPKAIWRIFSSASYLATIVSFILVIIEIKKLPAAFRALAAFLLLGVLAESYQRIAYYVFHANYNLYIVPIYYLLEFATLGILYFKYLLKVKKKNSIPLGVLFFFILAVEGFRSIYFDNAQNYTAYGKVLVNLFVIILCVRFFIEMARNSGFQHGYKLYLNISIFIYYVVCLIIFVSINYLINGLPKLTIYFWIFHAAISFVFYTSLGLIIWRTPRNQ